MAASAECSIRLKKLIDLDMPYESKLAENIDFETKIVIVRRVRFLPDGRLAALAESNMASWGDVLYLWDLSAQTPGLSSAKPTKAIQEKIDESGRDIAVMSSSDVLMLRDGFPGLRVFDVENGLLKKNRHVGIPVKNFHFMMSIETVEDKILVVYGAHPPRQLLVLDEFGLVRQDGEVDDAWKMCYDKSTGVLYIAARKGVVRCRCDAEGLRKIISAPHGVEGFTCLDVAVGTDGAVFLVGRMENKSAEASGADGDDVNKCAGKHGGGEVEGDRNEGKEADEEECEEKEEEDEKDYEVRVYEFIEGKEGDDVTLEEVKFKDGQERRCDDVNCSIAVHDKKLVLSRNEFIEVFELEN